jgi:hypothetical protein
MSLISAKGSQAKENAQKQQLDLKQEYISLKENESVKVRILGAEDYVEYKAHGSFSHKIYTRPCSLQSDCPLCVASRAGIEEFNPLKARPRYLFAFYVMDEGKVKLFDATKTQAKKLIASIEEYGDDLQELAFNFKRTGNGKDTDYSLNPIIKLKGKDQENFDNAEGMKVDIKFFEERLEAKLGNDDYMVKLLHEAGFPVDDHFDAELVAKALEEKDENAEVTEVDDTDINDVV